MKAGALYIAIFMLALLTLPMVAMHWGPSDGVDTREAVVHTPVVPDMQPQPAEQYGEAELTLALEPEGSPGLADTPPATPADSGDEEEITVSEAVPANTAHGVLSFRIYDQTTGTVSEVGLRDYVRGAVASEMPVTFHEEALKAQAVAAHTYALRHHTLQQENPDPTLYGADFAADPSQMKGYITEEKAKQFYGETYGEVYWEKICSATDSVLSYILEYDGEPIVAAYHAMSAGRTEAADNVWNGGAGYLVPADSEGDYLAPDYEMVTTLSVEAVREAIATAYPAAVLAGDPSGWFSDIARSESGYITGVNVGGLELHGKDIRTLFDLRSHNMDIACTGTGFTFTVRGHGHGVGMSQYGADFLARQGYSFDEILEHYYQGASLRIVDFDALA
ncbi:stage II sporulation protein D [Ruminococcaceae bacterium OttesenSCG-928-L11]|nr:stage II sporulation protein D [Ruminococcaceae bacterium OttesenSCG-928-L11]